MKDQVPLAARCGVAALTFALTIALSQTARVPAASAAGGATRPGQSERANGRALFVEKCGMCHRQIGMGTGLLARRVPPGLAELEKRRDLPAENIELAVRSGIGNMPALSRAEVSDAQLTAISNYLREGGK